MLRKVVRKERGVFEKEPGSDIWWIRFSADGVEHREKVGRRGDVIKLYKIRKADILRGVKMPANMKDRGVNLSVLAQEATDSYINHERRDTGALMACELQDHAGCLHPDGELEQSSRAEQGCKDGGIESG